MIDSVKSVSESYISMLIDENRHTMESVVRTVITKELKISGSENYAKLLAPKIVNAILDIKKSKI